MKREEAYVKLEKFIKSLEDYEQISIRQIAKHTGLSVYSINANIYRLQMNGKVDIKRIGSTIAVQKL